MSDVTWLKDCEKDDCDGIWIPIWTAEGYHNDMDPERVECTGCGETEKYES